MDFFRKYQKPILYFAVFFALIVFSITGDVMNFFGSIFRDQQPTASIAVHGHEAHLTERDFRTARAIVLRHERGDPVMVMPNLGSVDPNDRLSDTYAVLRREALEEGIEASWDEADQAIEAVARAFDSDPTNLIPVGFPSYESYRTAVWESLRIATLARLEMLGARPFGHDAVEDVLDDAELVKLRVASIDGDEVEKQLQEDLDARDDASEVVRKWVDELEDDDPMRRQFVDEERFQVEFAGIRVAEFDPTAFASELEGFEVSDEEARKFYDVNRFNLYRYEVEDEAPPKDGEEKEDGNGETDPKDDAPKDEDEKDGAAEDGSDTPQDTEKPKKFEIREFDEVKDDVIRRKQAEHVMQQLWKQIQLALFDHLAPQIDARTEAFAAMNEADAAQIEAKTALKEDPDNEELSAALEAAQESYEAKREAHEAAEKAVTRARDAFDPLAKFVEIAGGRKGVFTLDSGEKPLSITGLVKLDGLGDWTNAWAVRAMTAGQVSSQVQFSKDCVFQFRVGETEQNKIKGFEDIEEDATAAYLSQQADEKVEKAKEDFEAALARLSREKLADRVGEIEGKKQTRLDEQMTEWREGVESSISEAEAQLATTSSTRAKTQLEKRLATLREELAAADDKRAEFEKAIDAELETEVDEALADAYSDVLEVAAAEAGMTITEVGPYRRNPPTYGPIDYLPKPIQVLFYRDHIDDLEVGDATEVIEDSTLRTVQFAIVDEVKPATVADMSRREFVDATFTYRRRVISSVSNLNYGIEAFKARLGYTEPGDETAKGK
ncbi:MAG: hypothetical protein KDB80_17440 [Planctomycetes bacterium]|nr:hypothetical protein [Planctomycetota bacterium]